MKECTLEHCEKNFEILFKKLDKMDEAIRGNGKPGIQARLGSLESKAKSQSRLLWMLVGACLSVATTVAIALILR